MNWRGIELERDGQGWRATEDGVFFEVAPWVRHQWMARVCTSRWHHVDGYGSTPEVAIAQCDERCKEMAAELMKGLES